MATIHYPALTEPILPPVQLDWQPDTVRALPRPVPPRRSHTVPPPFQPVDNGPIAWWPSTVRQLRVRQAPTRNWSIDPDTGAGITNPVDLPRPGPRTPGVLDHLPRDTRRSSQRRGRALLADAINSGTFPEAWEQSVIDIVSGSGGSTGGLQTKAAILSLGGPWGIGVTEQCPWDVITANGGDDWYFFDTPTLELLEPGVYLIVATCRPNGSADDDFTISIGQNSNPVGVCVGAIAHGAASNATAVVLLFADANDVIDLTGSCDNQLEFTRMYIIKLGALS